MKAHRQHRVMTLHQTVRGSTKDYGTIGLQMDAHAQILVFPRSLKKFSDRRVIGIDYSAIGEAATSLPASTARHASRSLARSKIFASAHDNASATGKITPFPGRAVEKTLPPSKPPIAWQAIARKLARAKSAFQKRDYTGAAEVFQKISEALRN